MGRIRKNSDIKYIYTSVKTDIIYDVKVNRLIKKSLTFIYMNAKINLLKHNVLTNVCVSDTSRSCLLKMSRGTAPLTEEIENQRNKERNQ